MMYEPGEKALLLRQLFHVEIGGRGGQGRVVLVGHQGAQESQSLFDLFGRRNNDLVVKRIIQDVDVQGLAAGEIEVLDEGRVVFQLQDDQQVFVVIQGDFEELLELAGHLAVGFYVFHAKSLEYLESTKVLSTFLK